MIDPRVFRLDASNLTAAEIAALKAAYTNTYVDADKSELLMRAVAAQNISTQ